MPNRSSYRSRQNKSLELPNQQEKEPSKTPKQLPTPKSTSPGTILTLSRDITPSTDPQSIEDDSESTLRAEIGAESASSSIPNEPSINTNSRNVPVHARSAVSVDPDVANILPEGLKRIKRPLRKQA